MQKSEANTTKVSQDFHQALERLLSQEKYKNLKADVIFDQGDYIVLAIDSITQSLILGAVFAMLVLFLFLRGIKSPIIIAVAIPYSVIVTFVLMYFADFTLNMMTLGGLALGVGMLVDNSIVVIENINRHLAMGKEPKKAASDGVKEIGAAIFASTMTTIAVFIPVVFISGLIGDLMVEFSVTIAFSLLSSLFVAVTVVPMLASKMLKTPQENLEEKRQNSPFYKGLERAVRWCLRHRLSVVSIVMVMLIIGVFGLRNVGTEFFPATDEGFFSIRIDLENGMALSETEKVVAAVEEELRGEEAVDVFVSLIGSTQNQSFQGGSSKNVAEMYIRMKPLDERDISVFELIEKKRDRIEQAAKAVNDTAEVNIFMHSSMGIEPNTLSFNVMDTNRERLETAVRRIEDALQKRKEVTEVSHDLSESVEEVQITIDKDKALSHGLLPGQIAMLVNDVTRGVTATTIMPEDGTFMDVRVEYDESVTRDAEKLKELLIRKNDGTYVELGEVASIEKGTSPVQVQRHNQHLVSSVSVKYSTNISLGEIVKIVEDEIEQLDLHEEIKTSYTGEQEMFESTIGDMLLALVWPFCLFTLSWQPNLNRLSTLL